MMLSKPFEEVVIKYEMYTPQHFSYGGDNPSKILTESSSVTYLIKNSIAIPI